MYFISLSPLLWGSDMFHGGAGLRFLGLPFLHFSVSDHGSHVLILTLSVLDTLQNVIT